MVLGLVINFGGRKVETKRKVRDFDEDLSRFQRDQKSLFESRKGYKLYWQNS